MTTLLVTGTRYEPTRWDTKCARCGHSHEAHALGRPISGTGAECASWGCRCEGFRDVHHVEVEQ